MRGPRGGGFLIGRPICARKPSARASFASPYRRFERKSTHAQSISPRTNGSYASRTNFGFSLAAHCRRRRIGHFACRSSPGRLGIGTTAAGLVHVCAVALRGFIDDGLDVAHGNLHARMGRTVTPNMDEGGLIAYGPSLHGAFRQVTTLVDKILKGAMISQSSSQRAFLSSSILRPRVCWA
jgi:hypothetical protein